MGLMMTVMRRNLGAWDAEVADAATRYGVDPDLLDAIIAVESSGNPDARGTSGEVGLMQVMPSTAQMVDPSVSTAALWDPATNIDVGAHYLANQLARYGGDVARAVSAYNAGTATDANQSYVDRVLGALLPSAQPDDARQPPLDVSPLLAWIQDNPWWAGGIVGAIIWLMMRRR